MYKTTLFRIIISIMATVVIFFPKEVLSGELLSVSIKHLLLEKSERIVGFEVKITSGEISSLPRVPSGWDIIVNNDPSSNTKIRGGIIVGAVSFDDISFFKDFIIIERADRKEPVFNIEVEIVTTIDFEKEKRYLLRKDDLLLKKIKENHQ